MSNSGHRTDPADFAGAVVSMNGTPVGVLTGADFSSTRDTSVIMEVSLGEDGHVVCIEESRKSYAIDLIREQPFF